PPGGPQGWAGRGHGRQAAGRPHVPPAVERAADAHGGSRPGPAVRDDGGRLLDAAAAAPGPERGRPPVRRPAHRGATRPPEGGGGKGGPGRGAGRAARPGGSRGQREEGLMSLSNRLMKIEERLAAQTTPDSDRERLSQIYASLPLEVALQLLESIRRAIERNAAAGDPNAPVRHDDLDLPERLKRKLEEAFDNGGWRDAPETGPGKDQTPG